VHHRIDLSRHVLALTASAPPADAGEAGDRWLAVVAGLVSWRSPASTTLSLERRIYRHTRRGELRAAITAHLDDPFGLLSEPGARSELEELVRPLRTAQALRVLPVKQRSRLLAPRAQFAVETTGLGELVTSAPTLAGRLLAEVVAGLGELGGPVGVSLLVSPPASPPGGEDVERTVAFALRLYAQAPLPGALLARAALFCGHQRDGTEWRHAYGEHECGELIGRRPAGEDEIAWVRAATALALMPEPSRADAAVSSAPVTGPLPRDGAPLGRVARPDGRRSLLRLPWSARRHHVFVAGASGCGKSTMLMRLAADDIAAGRALVVLDPHGDLADDVSALAAGVELVRIDPRPPDSSPLDLLDPVPARAAAHLMSAVSEVWPAEFAGPVWTRSVSVALRVLATSAVSKRPLTLAQVERFFVDPDWRLRVLRGQFDERLRAEGKHLHESLVNTTGAGSSLVDWTASKLTPLTEGPAAALFARAGGQPLEELLAPNRVIIVALPIGVLGAATARLAARMFLTRLATAIASADSTDERQRAPVSVVIDEAPVVAGATLAALFAQSRKFNTSLTLACQAPSQLGPHLREILTNAQTALLGRLPMVEALTFADRLGPAAATLARLPARHMVLVREDHDPADLPIVLAPIPPVSSARAQA